MVDDRIFQPDKFKVFVRYMIEVAKHKRCVPYYELENVFGLSHAQVGIYAGTLGDYCFDRKIPPLNGLIISTTDCVPSDGFDWYMDKYKRTWGEIVSECWRHFHNVSTREMQVKDFAKRDADVDAFLERHKKPGYIR